MCRGYGEVHEAEKCSSNEFYYLIRQLYISTKYAGILPEKDDKLINQTLFRSNLVRVERSNFCIVAYGGRETKEYRNDPFKKTDFIFKIVNDLCVPMGARYVLFIRMY